MIFRSWWNLLLVCHSQPPGCQGTDQGGCSKNVAWCSCCTQDHKKRGAFCSQVHCSSPPYCFQGSSERLPQRITMLPLATSWSSWIRVRICGPSNTPALIFSNDNPGKAVMMCWKHSPSISSTLTDCFIKPNLMWRGGKMILSLFTIGSCTIFGMPASRVSRIGQSFWTQCLFHAQLSHICGSFNKFPDFFCTDI